MHDGHGRFDIFQRKMVLVRMTLLGFRAIKGALEVGEQLLKPEDAIFFTLDDATLL